jgi:hypothetical protein
MTSLPETLVQFRTDLEDAIGRDQVIRVQQGKRRRRAALLVAAAVVVTVGAASALAIVGDIFFDPFPQGRVSRTVEGVRFSFTVPRPMSTKFGPRGWENGPLYRVVPNDADSIRSRNLYISKSIERGQAAEAVIFWTGLRDRTQAAPCAKLLGPAVKASTAEIASAVARAPGTKLIEGPTRVTVGGRPARHVVLTVQKDRGCDPGYFFTWRPNKLSEMWGAFWPWTDVGDTIRVWIVDVGATRLFIQAETKQPSDGAHPAIRAEFEKIEQEIAKIVESIRFD